MINRNYSVVCCINICILIFKSFAGRLAGVVGRNRRGVGPLVTLNELVIDLDQLNFSTIVCKNKFIFRLIFYVHLVTFYIYINSSSL